MTMSKELEAFRSLMERLSNNVTLNEWDLCNKDMQTVEDFIEKKALTPPTEEEVCKALSEYFEKTVYFFENRGFFVQRYKEKQSYRDYSLSVYSNGKLRIFHPFPPHLVTLIGRFYEGLDNE